MAVDVEEMREGVVRGYVVLGVRTGGAGEGCGEEVGEVEEVD